MPTWSKILIAVVVAILLMVKCGKLTVQIMAPKLIYTAIEKTTGQIAPKFTQASLEFTNETFEQLYGAPLDDAETAEARQIFSDYYNSKQFKLRLRDIFIGICPDYNISTARMAKLLVSTNPADKTALEPIFQNAARRIIFDGGPADLELLKYWMERHPEYEGLEMINADYPHTPDGNRDFIADTIRISSIAQGANDFMEQFSESLSVTPAQRQKLLGIFIESLKQLYTPKKSREIANLTLEQLNWSEEYLEEVFRFGTEPEENMLDSLEEAFTRADGKVISDESYDDCYEQAAKKAAKILPENDNAWSILHLPNSRGKQIK
ncbi:MAG: hypothetical protein AB7F40_04140 [Victivallaceae bacterium]|nr:hypothetical protein [Victivallaceae bacterium]